MLTVWGRTNSTNVKKVLWCLEEMGLAYENIPAGGAFGMVQDPAYRAMNPNGLVPTLKDGEFVLWESNAIVRYLAARYAPGDLAATDPGERALADRWMDWTSSTIAPAIAPIIWGLLRTKPENRDPAAIEAARKRASEALAIADEALGRMPYLSGDRFGMGDIPLGCFAYAWFGLPIERPDLPALTAWYDRLAERPAYRKVVMVPLT
ncbi:Glutathione S-transferase [Kaistia soli DSM 19436]|uniref:Glutathione S-transferase n=1 Tax=Kaistia soli DSM 19436 TaxID=1122133 RepID=A0A1M4UCR1_9HYPH|nr:glutathione S-transferase [Kaistia soli]SHE54529.1 Glutathione S-transferase [Kaistia soli DSM 19436]